MSSSPDLPRKVTDDDKVEIPAEREGENRSSRVAFPSHLAVDPSYDEPRGEIEGTEGY